MPTTLIGSFVGASMTATSVLIVPPCAIESSHMSIRHSSRFRDERSRHTAGAWRWGATRQEEVAPVPVGGGLPARLWIPRSVVLLLFSFSFLSLLLSAHSQVLDEFSKNRTALNQQIYVQAFDYLNTLSRIQTGLTYNVSVPSNITDNAVELESIRVVRLRNGSLKRYGVVINEINVPNGTVVVEPLRYVVLVYRRFKKYGYYNRSSNETVFVAPVVGILAYNFDNIRNYTTDYGSELTVVSGSGPGDLPFQVQLQLSWKVASNELTCISYNNTVNGTNTGVVKNVTGSSLCEWNVLGDFALLGPPHRSKSNTWKIIVGSVVGGLAAIVLLILAVVLLLWYVEKHRFAGMEQKSDQGEPLHHSWFGGSRAPKASGTRTKPILENENV